MYKTLEQQIRDRQYRIGERRASAQMKLTGALEDLFAEVGGARVEKARLADEDVASALGLELGDPVLFVERLMFGRGARPLEVVRSHYRADVYRYQITLVRSARAGFRWRRATRAARRTPERSQRERQTWQR